MDLLTKQKELKVLLDGLAEIDSNKKIQVVPRFDKVDIYFDIKELDSNNVIVSIRLEHLKFISEYYERIKHKL
jgi:predicted NACHT family NTPase